MPDALTFPQGGYITPATYGVPTASERGAESKVAYKWARWLHNPYRLWGPHRFTTGAKSEVAHIWARWLQKTPVASGVPTALERGAALEVAHTWVPCLHACIFSTIGNSFFAVRSCNFYIFAVNACRKKSSHRVIFFAVNACNKKIVTSCNFFFAVSHVIGFLR